MKRKGFTLEDLEFPATGGGVLSPSADKRRGLLWRCSVASYTSNGGTMASTSDADASDLESIRRKLMKSLASSWEEVVQIYEQDPRAHKIEIGPSRNTALHYSSFKCITDECKELLGYRNRERDTPLLRAARYGKKDVFLWLYDMCEGNAAAGYCKNDDGKNVLHLAIEGGHMDLAFQIICKQEDLMDSVDWHQISPLHVLAEKPTAFRSGIHLGWFNKIIYHCISVEELILQDFQAKKSFFQELRKLIKLPGKSKKHLDPENPEEGQGIEHHGHNSTNIGAQGHKPFHSKYGRCLRFKPDKEAKREKEMHMWSLQILNKLLERGARCTYEMNPKNEYHMRERGNLYVNPLKNEFSYLCRSGMTPILLASRNGIVEMVEKILQLFPMAIHDTNGFNQNIVLTAVENRQSHIYDFLLNSSHLIDKEGAFHAVDCEGNNALHLAGKLAGYRYLQRIPTSMLQMQWEVKWYQYVQNSLPPHFVVQKNDRGDTPDEIFQIEHQELEDASKQWLNSTSNSCSFIAALIATVAFASSASVPGGVKQDTGEPVFENHLAFSIFAMASLVALCCSVISLLIFLAIFISKDQDKDFTTNLPRNFLFGLTSLFISMAAMLTCFCSGNFLMLNGQLKYAAILVPERIYKEYL
ncbi:hypothetical protein CK203_000022 [Vitis vinifera]|uniref:PGG domain-containing protein n=1 Tax=Vitis vinifera TaxID=29760 RepID=A0A438KRB0_VITVI|nr:hypothetical protein CK203_000022 [Vitis vinifera]